MADAGDIPVSANGDAQSDADIGDQGGAGGEVNPGNGAEGMDTTSLPNMIAMLASAMAQNERLILANQDLARRVSLLETGQIASVDISSERDDKDDHKSLRGFDYKNNPKPDKYNPRRGMRS